MKKLFSKEIILYPTLILVSLFLLPNIVKADTYNLTFNSSYFDILNSTAFNYIKSYADDYCSTNNCTYFITANTQQGYRSNYYFSSSSSTRYLLSGYSNRVLYNIQGGGSWRSCSHNYSTGVVISCSDNQSYPAGEIKINFDSSGIITAYDLLYSNFPSSAFTFDSSSATNTNNVYNISYLNYTGVVSKTNPNIIGLSELYEIANTTPDSTPLLTQFFDISLEKLSLVCEFITSSYIYLSIFVIFIIYFTILLLRRLK